MIKKHINDARCTRLQNKLLGKKRALIPPSMKMLSRQQSREATIQEYERVSKIYKHLFSFNWEDAKIVTEKLHPFENLNSCAYWFFISSVYFPTEMHSLKQKINELRESVINQMALSKPAPKKNSSNCFKTDFTQDICSLFKKGSEDGGEIDSIEEKLNEAIIQISEINKQKINTLLQFNYDINSHGIHLVPDHNIKYPLLKNVLLTCKEKQDYFGLVLRNQKHQIENLKKQKIILSLKDQTKRNEALDEDGVCCVCNNGDYEENVIILHCSECQVAVHQSCYGITTLPEDDWICKACKTLSKAESENLECMLCPVKGGAMKQCSLHVNSTFVSLLKRLRQTQLEKNYENSPNNTTISTPNDCIGYNSIISIPNCNYIGDDIHSEEASPFAWVHLSCALWNSEIEVKDFAGKEDIRNIEFIDPSRFEEFCNVCKMKNYGPTFKCERENCNFRSHIECARINGYSLEILNVKGIVKLFHLKYNIYCLSHSPTKLLKTIDNRNKQKCEDILEFANTIEKIFKNYKREYKYPLIQEYTHTNTNTNSNSNSSLSKPATDEIISSHKDTYSYSKSTIKKHEKINFIQQLKQLCKSLSNLNSIPMRREIKDDGSISYEFLSSAFKNRMRYQEVLSNKDFPWYLIKLKNRTVPQLKEIFKEIFPNEIEYNRIILKRSKFHKANDMKVVSIINQDGKDNFVEQYVKDNNVYCYCKRGYGENDFMISCTNEKNCKGSIDGWFHPSCVEELKTKSKSELRRKGFVYICRECKNNSSS